MEDPGNQAPEDYLRNHVHQESKGWVAEEMLKHVPLSNINLHKETSIFNFKTCI